MTQPRISQKTHKNWNTEKISRSVQVAESKTSGEIVPVITRQLDTYLRVDLLGTVGGFFLSSLALKLIAHPIHWDLSLDTLLSIQSLSALFGYCVVQIPQIKRGLLGRSILNRNLQQTAQSLFVELGLTETQDRTGILILISEFEHRVAILADRGIHEKVPNGFWDQEVSQIVHGIREGKATEALCTVIEQIGDKLSESFPKQAEDHNELPDQPVLR